MYNRAGIASAILVGIPFISWFFLFCVGISVFDLFTPAKTEPKKSNVDLSIRRKVRCYYLKLEKDFLEKSVQKSAKRPYPPSVLGIFDRNGTEFLFEGSPHGRSPLWMETLQNKVKTICDSSQDDGFDHRVDFEFVQKRKRNRNRITVVQSEDSKFLLDQPVTIDVPSDGSFIIKSSSPPTKSKADFLWIEVSEIHDIDNPNLIRESDPERPLQTSPKSPSVPSG